VGLLGREIEACGVTTVALSLVRELSAQVKAPRMLFLHWPFGHALGEPHNSVQQETVLHDMFSMARLAPHAGLVVDLPYQWRRQVYEPVADWTSPSQEFTQGLARALQKQEEIRE
jgi:D-proline reductase (dithiol) PrdB